MVERSTERTGGGGQPRPGLYGSHVLSGRGLRDAGKRVLGRAFVAGQALGVDVLPRHFYSSIPDIRALRASDSWRGPRSMHGVLGIDLDEQLGFLRSCLPEAVRQRLARTAIHADACAQNEADGYGPIEAEVLYAFVSSRRPSRVVQVGAGVSTAVLLQAKRDLALQMDVVCVDPFPTGYLRRAAGRGDIHLYAEPAQTVELSVLTGLEDGDLLFVDSTHTVKPGSEVLRLMLEVLPRLKAGVFTHFHDISWPYDYGPGLLDGDLFFWEESALLHAFMVGNSTATIKMSLSMLHHQRPAELQELLPHYRPRPMADGLFRGAASGTHFPSSTFLQRLSPAPAHLARPT